MKPIFFILHPAFEMCIFNNSSFLRIFQYFYGLVQWQAYKLEIAKLVHRSIMQGVFLDRTGIMLYTERNRASERVLDEINQIRAKKHGKDHGWL